jgi:REP element-mobilizing transposase RayT
MNAGKNNIRIYCINGFKDHVHLLINLHPVQNLADVVHRIKGDSSHWINKNRITAKNSDGKRNTVLSQ